MNILQSDPFLLYYGDEIVSKVLASNLIGDSPYSADSSENPGTGGVI